MSIIQTATLAWAQPAGVAAEPAPAPAGVEGAASEAQGASGPPLGGCGAMGGYQGIIMMLAMFVIFYFLLIRPQQKKAKEHQKMLDAIKKGDEIVTTGGLIGKVTAVTGRTVTLEVSEKVRVRVARSQVAGPFAAETGEKK
jgi:preprotein translocase subunit YajC